MTIQAVQRFQNIVASIESYAQSTLVTIDGLVLGFQGVPFDTRQLSSWVELNFLDMFSKGKYRNVGSSVHGAEQRFMIQLACFARIKNMATGIPLNRGTLYALRDKVAARFQLGREIPIKDHANAGTTTIDTMFVADISEQSMARARTTSSSVDLDAGLNSWVFTVTLRYVHPHAAA